MSNILLYLIPSFIWGSTWLAITFQLGTVDPALSVFYRFGLASLILFLYCLFTRRRLRYSVKEHLAMAVQGIFLFCLGYWPVYLAQRHLTSGLVAILFSLIIFLNILNGAIFLKAPIRFRVFIGGTIGIIGTGLVFWKDLLSFNLSSTNSLALVFALLGVFSASIGDILSAWNQKRRLPVIQTNVYGMLYGAFAMFIIFLITGAPFRFEATFPYIASLLYLAVFGSVIAFGCFLTLLGKIGADKAAYVTLVIPVIALTLSTLFEGYTWNVQAFTGVALILIGNGFIIERKKTLGIKQPRKKIHEHGEFP